MLLNIMKSKLHNYTVTDANLNYKGSISIDKRLMEQAELLPYEQVHVVNKNNGERIITYVIESDKPNEICLNGAAARKFMVGDNVIIISYCQMEDIDAKYYKPVIVVNGAE